MNGNLVKYLVLAATFIFIYEFAMSEKLQNVTNVQNPVAETQFSGRTPGLNVPDNLDYSDVIDKIRAEEGMLPSKRHVSQTNFFSSKGMTASECLSVANESAKLAKTVSDPDERTFLLLKALFFTDASLKGNPADKSLLVKAGMLACDLKNRTTAKKYLMKAYALYPEDPSILKAMGDFSYSFDEYNTALEYYKAALAGGLLKDEETNIATAQCYSKLGDSENALLYWQIVLYLNPDSVLAVQKISEIDKTFSASGKSDEFSESQENSHSSDIDSIIEKTFEIKN